MTIVYLLAYRQLKKNQSITRNITKTSRKSNMLQSIM